MVISKGVSSRHELPTFKNFCKPVIATNHNYFTPPKLTSLAKTMTHEQQVKCINRHKNYTHMETKEYIFKKR